MKRRTAALFVVTLITGVLILIGRPANAATFILVDDDGAGSGSSCDAAGVVPTSIQTAVNLSSVNGTVKVCPGVYNETVTVDKQLTLLGAQAGGNPLARTPGGPAESTVQGNSATGVFYVQASGVVINGFTIRNNAAGPGILIPGSFSGTQVLSNIITNNVTGINANGTNTSIISNLIDNNNQAGPANGNGIYGDQAITNLVINLNTIRNQQNAGILIVGDPAFTPSALANGVSINQNTITEASNSFIIFYGGSNITINQNKLSNTVVNPPGGSGIFLSDVTKALVQGNTVTRANFSGIVVATAGAVVPSGVKLNSNVVTFSGGNGIDVRASTPGGVTTQGNTATSNAIDGIIYQGTATGNLVQGNTARTNGAFDCHDTTGPANTWQGNRGTTSSPAGLCQP